MSYASNAAELFRFSVSEPEHQTETVFDIFSGTPGEKATWLETVIGAANARDRMEEIAERGDIGHFFAVCRESQCIVCETLWN